MKTREIALRRLFSHRMTGAAFTDPAALVKWMGCIRAEDFSDAKWAIGRRVAESTDDSIEQAFNQGVILRAYVLQPVRHFIAPEDIRWMLALTAPRLKALNKGLYQALDIDDDLLKKSKRVISRVLEKGQMTRLQLLGILEKSHILVDDLRLGMLLMDAELDGIICSGSKHGGAFTYSLLEERAPVTHRYERKEAIAELTRRYFLSRGPATAYDLSMWSGLRPAEIAAGIAANKAWLDSEVVDGQEYWFDPSPLHPRRSYSFILLPAGDELTVAYTNHVLFKPVVVVDGQPWGSWTRTLGKDTVTIEVSFLIEPDRHILAAMKKEAERYSAFLGKRLVLPGM